MGSENYRAAIGSFISSAKNGRMAHEALAKVAGVRNAKPNAKVCCIESSTTLTIKRLKTFVKHLWRSGKV